MSQQKILEVISNSLSSYNVSKEDLVVNYVGLSDDVFKKMVEDSAWTNYVKGLLVLQTVSNKAAGKSQNMAQNTSLVKINAVCTEFEKKFFADKKIRGVIASRVLTALKEKLVQCMSGRWSGVSNTTVYFITFKNAAVSEDEHAKVGEELAQIIADEKVSAVKEYYVQKMIRIFKNAETFGFELKLSDVIVGEIYKNTTKNLEIVNKYYEWKDNKASKLSK